MKKGQVSIITPAYNVAGFIRETIDSVRSQSYSNWEMIIADDGSTDATVEIATQASEGDSRIRIEAFPHSGLPSTTRNRALTLAGGEFVAFLDSDDLWESQKLEKQLTSMAANGKRWGFANMSRFGAEQGAKYSDSWRPSRPFYNDLLSGNGIPCLTIITEMDLLLDVCEHRSPQTAFDETERLKAGEDWDLALRLARIAEPDYQPESLARYRIHPQGISRSFVKNYDCAMGVIEKHRDLGTDRRLIGRASDWQKSKLAINLMLHTNDAWRGALFMSSIRHALSLRNLFFALLSLLPRPIAKKAYGIAISSTSPL